MQFGLFRFSGEIMLSKKGLGIAILVLGSLLAYAALANADSIGVGTMITFVSAPGRPAYGGGLFGVKIGAGGVSFYTFCVESDEHISFGTQYVVHDTSQYAIGGGSGGPDPDPISGATAYLYRLFRTHTVPTIAGIDPYADVSIPLATLYQNVMQNLIWKYEQEPFTAAGDPNYVAVFNGLKALADPFKDFDNPDPHYMVFNPADKSYDFGKPWEEQRDLLRQSGLMVPEPGSLMLLGMGLLAIGGVVARKKSR